MSLFVSLLPLAAYAFFMARRLLQYLHIFQQEEYEPLPFLRWVAKTGSFDKRVSAALVLTALACLIPIPAPGKNALITGIFLLSALFENDPRKIAKKKLVMTQRARRIFGVAFLLCLVLSLAGLEFKSALFWIAAVQFAPLSLTLADILLIPLETNIQKRILSEASAVLSQINPKIVGITGSFGKTSVKHILGHILEMNAPTLFTPGSVNTLMGVSRVIREKLRPGTRFFLVEMGAYGQGSIRKLCGLTPPDIGVITALGEAHYERFKTLDSIARAKFEVADAVLSHNDGKTVVHENVLAQDYACEFVEKHRDRFLVCGRAEGSDLTIGDVRQTAFGVVVEVRWQEKDFALFAPLYGEVHANNVALAFAAALACGVAPERAAAALRTVPQISHRLEVKHQENGTTIIDDAYNANPRGFAAALDLLTLLAAEKKSRRILISPGILELGEKNDEIHRDLGEKAAQNADIAVIVRSDKIPAFAEGFRSKAGDKELRLVASFKEAQEWLMENAKAPDVILIENDLPDVDEAKLAL